MEDICTRIKALVEPIAGEVGVELVDVEYSGGKGGGAGQGRKERLRTSSTLRILIASPTGVTVKDCTTISRELSAILDVEDILPEAYMLEVSSPGLDRPLTKEKDFRNVIGKLIRLKTKQPVEGRKNFKAVVQEVGDSVVTIKDSNGTVWRIALDDIDKARLEIVF